MAKISHKNRELIKKSEQAKVTNAFYEFKENAGTRTLKAHLKNDIVMSRQKIAPNRLNRNFNVILPNQVWVGDITEIKTTEGKGYLATYIDLFSRKVVGWDFESHMRSELVETALKRALWN
ncbi:DDE-type integrase/transposase/recombinase [Thiomicrorhabdus sp. Milos-T2]|uniref:DDE-type integrase/transposase/recombinase n=1 Tax=Thiomicrorhabdus sp. Milos-T2 TaxID=90814 RepID=UPI00068E4698|nr:DDE-type integrase/transposase/recombinase [Thiomicrorhabdus sp. Milos-T2]